LQQLLFQLPPPALQVVTIIHVAKVVNAKHAANFFKPSSLQRTRE
jgi:hypothetical protein